MKKCPICGRSALKEAKVEEEMFGVGLGQYDAEVCQKCGESFLDQSEMERMEARAKELGVWGLGKRIKVVKSGNSLSVRIPAQIAEYLDLTEGKSVFLYPDGKDRIVVEVS
ncbi:MAG: AbrB/MazE/SpoVT family DNA-binding domain-containing protein [Thermoplasmata archaeon]